MPCLAERQRTLAAAVLDPTLAATRRLIGPEGQDSARRFAVYRDNMQVALIDRPMRANFPTICRIVGAESFEAIPHNYAVSEPPASPVPLDYGAAFPYFIAVRTGGASALSGRFRPHRAMPGPKPIIRQRPFRLIPARCAASLRIGPRFSAPRYPSMRIFRSRFSALTRLPRPARCRQRCPSRFLPDSVDDYARNRRERRGARQAARVHRAPLRGLPDAVTWLRSPGSCQGNAITTTGA
ncbi:DUF2063 domain-containing protein [bacterium]|nr:MAG: DUF2063 domain-containing protein [bacterium]